MRREGRMLKASLTIEASAVISLCILFTGCTILLGLDTYQTALTEVSAETEKKEAVSVFRRNEMVKRVARSVTGKEE